MRFCHKLIQKTAEEMAACWYEEAAHSDVFYRAYRSQRKFITRHWKNFVGQARSTLAGMLAIPTLSDDVKEEIMDALLLDRSLPAGGRHVASLPSLH